MKSQILTIPGRDFNIFIENGHGLILDQDTRISFCSKLARSLNLHVLRDRTSLKMKTMNVARE